MQVKRLVVALLGISMLGVASWSYSTMSRRVGSISARLESISAGLVPVHTRCAKLEVLMEESGQKLGQLEQGLLVSKSEAQERAALFAENAAELSQLKSGLDQFQMECDRRLADIRAAVEPNSVQIETTDEQVTRLLDRVAWLEDAQEFFPAGTILPWLPEQGGIPPGWLLCDGSQGTPNLQGLFLRGVGRFDQSGQYFESSKMQPAGVHSHVTDINRSIYSLPRSTTKSPGDGLVLFDTGVTGGDPDALSNHGSHVHLDENIPAHFTVLYIMKEAK